MEPQVRVCVVDDHKLFRQGLTALLAREDRIEVVAEVGDADSGLALVLETRPDVVLLDIHMPGNDGIAVARKLAESGSQAAVVFLTMADDSFSVRRAVEAGCHAFVLKDADERELIEAVLSAYDKRSRLGVIEGAKIMERFRCRRRSLKSGSGTPWGLTDRELEILDGLARGLSNADIASRCAITERTVKYHVGNVLRKMDVARREQAAIVALQSGVAGSEQGRSTNGSVLAGGA